MNNTIEVTAEEIELITKRFARMYPNNKPLKNDEAYTIVLALKAGRSWLRIIKEEAAR